MKRFLIFALFLLSPVSVSGQVVAQGQPTDTNVEAWLMRIVDGGTVGQVDVTNSTPASTLYGLITRPILSPKEVTATLNDPSETLEIDVEGFSTVSVYWNNGGFCAPCNFLLFEATIDGTNWFLVPVLNQQINSWVSATGVETFFGMTPVAFKKFRVFLSVDNGSDTVVTLHAQPIAAAQFVNSVVTQMPSETIVVLKDWDTSTRQEVDIAGRAQVTLPGSNIEPPGFPSSGANSIDAVNDEMLWNTFGFGTLNLRMFGTWVGTIQIEGGRAFGNGEFSPLVCNDAVTFATQSSFTSNATVICSTAGLQYVKIRASAWTSGLAYPQGFFSAQGDRAPLQPVLGTKTNNGAAPDATNLGVLPYVANAADPTLTEGRQTAGSVTLAGYIRVTCNNCGGSTFADNGAFTFGTTPISNTGWVRDDTGTNTVTENSAATPRLNANRIALFRLTNDAGTAEMGTSSDPLFIRLNSWFGSAAPTVGQKAMVDSIPVVLPSNQSAIPVTGPLTDTELRATPVPVTGPLTDTQLRATPVPVSGTITANAGTGNFNVVGTKSNNGGVPGSTNLGTLPAVATAAAPTHTEGNQVGLSTDLAGSTRVTCTSGCGGAAAFNDNSAFTAGSTGITNVGGVFNDGLADVTSGNAAAHRITKDRAIHSNLRNNDGTEIASATGLPASGSNALVVRTPAASFDSGLIVSLPAVLTTVTSSTIRLHGILVINKAGGGRRITVTNLAGDAYLENVNVPANSSVFVQFGGVTVVGLRWFQSGGAAGSLNAQAVGEQ